MGLVERISRCGTNGHLIRKFKIYNLGIHWVKDESSQITVNSRSIHPRLPRDNKARIGKAIERGFKALVEKTLLNEAR